MEFRLVATDLDGTLLRSDGRASARTRAAIQAVTDRGAVVVICTARPPRWLHGIGLDGIAHEVAVAVNGAVVYDVARRSVVRRKTIERETAMALVHGLRRAVPGVAFAVETAMEFRHEPGYVPRAPVPPGSVIADAEEIVRDDVAKLCVRREGGTVLELATAARELVGDDHAVLTWSSDTLLEIGPPGVTKGSAVAEVAAELDVPAAEAIAFGDMPNDLPMLAWAGYAVAVANAHPEVLAVADEVTASNDDDGVAVVLERLASPVVHA
ncbi:MAG: Cof-type HAD-IIB family hydrolase [Mycobacteriales bacterium]